jgi:hypothetical protein
LTTWARAFAEIIYTASPQGQDTLTVRNGKRALARYFSKFHNLDKLRDWLQHKAEEEELSPTQAEALGTIDDLLFSPVLTSVLCGGGEPFRFGRKQSVVARIDRAELGDFDAFILALLLIGQHKGQVILPDGGFLYTCP